MPKSGGDFGAARPLPGQPGYKISETEVLEREAKDMEVRLQMLQERMQQQNLDDAAVSKGAGGSRWRSARPDKGSITSYAKDVQERIKRKTSEGPPVLQSAGASFRDTFGASNSNSSGNGNLHDMAAASKGPAGQARRPSRGPPQSQSQSQPQSQPQTNEGLDFRSKDIDNWTVLDVTTWLQAVMLGQYAPLFESNEINGPILLEISLEDLDYMGMTILGHRKVLLKGIEDLRRNRRVTITLAAAPSGSGSSPQRNQDTRLTSQSLESLRAPLQRPIYDDTPQSQSVHWSQLEPLANNKLNSLYGRGSASVNAADTEGMDGEIDEAAERAAFSEAVMDWRKGGGRVRIEREGVFPDSSASSSSSSSSSLLASSSNFGGSNEGSGSGGDGMWHNPFGGNADTKDTSDSRAAKGQSYFPSSSFTSASSSYLQQGGELDEAAEREEFRRAVEEWRGGGGGGGSKTAGKDSSSSTKMKSGATAGGLAGATGRTLADRLALELEAEQALIAQSLQRQREEATRKLDAANRGLEEARRSRLMQSVAPSDSKHSADDDDDDDLEAMGQSPQAQRQSLTNPSLDLFTPPLSPHESYDELDRGEGATFQPQPARAEAKSSLPSSLSDEKHHIDAKAQSKATVTLSLVETSMEASEDFDAGEDKGGYVVEEASDDD